MSGPSEMDLVRLTVQIGPRTRRLFELLCLQQEVTPSQVVQHLMLDYLENDRACGVVDPAGRVA